MRTLRSGMVVFGTTCIPVNVCSAAKRKEPTFRQLHKECSTPVKQDVYCPSCDVALDAGDIVKGYEFAKGEFVIAPAEEVEALTEGATPVIRINSFALEEEVSRLYADTNYILQPGKHLFHNYQVLSQAMDVVGLVGIGVQACWGKETPCIISTIDHVLVMTTAFCADELYDIDFVGDFPNDVSKDELAQALTNLGMMAQEPFSGEVMRSPARDAIFDYLDSKVSGSTFLVPEAEPKLEPSLDMLESLRESYNALKAKHDAERAEEVSLAERVA